MQRIDDVTGETIRLSAAQRDEQRQQIVALLMQVARQTDVNTRQTLALQALFEAHETRIALTEELEQMSGAFRMRSFVERLRWLFTGR
jgi:hypothetical protein